VTAQIPAASWGCRRAFLLTHNDFRDKNSDDRNGEACFLDRQIQKLGLA